MNLQKSTDGKGSALALSPKSRGRKRAEDAMDHLYQYLRDMESLASRYSLLPQELQQQHVQLLRSGWRLTRR